MNGRITGLRVKRKIFEQNIVLRLLSSLQGLEGAALEAECERIYRMALNNSCPQIRKAAEHVLDVVL